MPAPERRLGGPGFAVVETARETITSHAMLSKGDAVLVALSGGPDSTCLLDVLWRLASPMDLTLEIAHVDHGLSESSEEVATRVATQAARDGFEVHLVRAPDLSGPNLHARARDFRYAFFHAIAEQIGARHIATGHTLDDRVETTLARLVHGATTEGLAGLPPTDGVRVRPLIDLRRAQTRAYCDSVGLAYTDDPANDDERFERAAIRTALVATIEERWGEGAIRAIARSSEYLREDSLALAELTERLSAELVRPDDDGMRIDKGAFAALPRALQRRVLEGAVGRVRDRSGGIEAALEGLATGGRPGARFAVAGGVEISFGATDIHVTGRSADEVAQ